MTRPINKTKLIAYIKEELPNVAKMKAQFTFDEIDKLEEDGYTKSEIHRTLEAMENFLPLNKKYRSVYRTCRNWINLERKREARFKSTQLKKLGLNSKMEHSEALTYLERKGIHVSKLMDYFTPKKEANDKTYWHLKQ